MNNFNDLQAAHRKADNVKFTIGAMNIEGAIKVFAVRRSLHNQRSHRLKTDIK